MMMQVLAAIFPDSQDMHEKFNENPDAYPRIMDNDLLPIVYRRCNINNSNGAIRDADKRERSDTAGCAKNESRYWLSDCSGNGKGYTAGSNSIIGHKSSVHK